MEDNVLGFLAAQSRTFLGVILTAFWSFDERHDQTLGVGRRWNAAVPNLVRKAGPHNDILLDMDVVEEYSRFPAWPKGCEVSACL